MVLVRLERRFVLLDTRETNPDGIEDRYREYADSDRRSGVHMQPLGHLVIGVDLAKTEDERRQQIAQEQTA